MINIPYAGIRPATPYAIPQLPIMPMPVPRGSVAQQQAASVLPLRPPAMPDPTNILTQFAQGADAAGQLHDYLNSPQSGLLGRIAQGIFS